MTKLVAVVKCAGCRGESGGRVHPSGMWEAETQSLLLSGWSAIRSQINLLHTTLYQTQLWIFAEKSLRRKWCGTLAHHWRDKKCVEINTDQCDWPTVTEIRSILRREQHIAAFWLSSFENILTSSTQMTNCKCPVWDSAFYEKSIDGVMALGCGCLTDSDSQRLPLVTRCNCETAERDRTSFKSTGAENTAWGSAWEKHTHRWTCECFVCYWPLEVLSCVRNATHFLIYIKRRGLVQMVGIIVSVQRKLSEVNILIMSVWCYFYRINFLRNLFVTFK